MLWPVGEAADPILRSYMSFRADGQQWTARMAALELPVAQGLRGQYHGHLAVELERTAEDTWILRNASPLTLQKTYLVSNSGHINLFPVEPFSTRTFSPSSRQLQTAAPWVYRQSMWESIRWTDYLDASILSSVSRWLREIDSEGRYLLAAVRAPADQGSIRSTGAHLFQGYLVIPWPE